MIELPGRDSTRLDAGERAAVCRDEERPALCLSPGIGHDAESQSLVPNQRDVLIAEGLGRCTEAQAITMASHGRDSEQRALARIRRFGARLNRDVGARINRQLVVVVSDVEV